MSNLLNLDEIEVGEEKSFKFKDQTHVMKPLSLGAYIKQVKMLESMDEKKSQAETMEFMVDSVRTAFPTLSKKDAEEMTWEQINMLMNHIQSDVTEEMEEGNAS